MAKRERRKPAAPPPDKPTTDGRLQEVVALAEEADCLYHLVRWTLLKGAPPRPQDWAADQEWPHPEAVAEIFDGWDTFVAQVSKAPLLARLAEAEERERDLGAREAALTREQERAQDLRRRLDVALRKREEAERDRDG